MNTLRSPAPGANFYNFGGFANRKNNVAANVAQVANAAANTVVNAANTVGDTFLNVANNVGKKVNTFVPNLNLGASNNANTGGGSGGFGSPTMSQIILIIFFVFIVVFLGVFWQQIRHGFNVLYQKLREMLGAAKAPEDPGATEDDGANMTDKPEHPADEQRKKNLVEKILPGNQQVFNISENRYTYYDAEPLCKALGSELATYDQVKEAYSKGADWCNYGWVKGQMAVYPTQQSTWDQLQNGPEDQRNACGQPGINGGHFDNPEMRFGVNCFGVKPDEKDHDANKIGKGDGAPLTPGALDFEKRAAKYRGEASHIAIMPFNRQAWSE
jgi:hypothetical protein